MPIVYRIVPEHRLTMARFRGEIYARDYVQVQRWLFEHPARTSGFDTVLDLRFADRVVIDSPDVLFAFRTLIKENVDRTSDRVAVVTRRSSEEAAADMFMLFSRGEGGSENRFCRTLEEAAVWLNKPFDVLIAPEDERWERYDGKSHR
jgi:hypothetical protein